MLSVIIPVKDEPSLGLFLGVVHKVLADIPDSYEVLVVQGDRETKNYPYPQLPHQHTIWTYGDSLERSILNGFSHAKGDKIIVMDADGSHSPSVIPQMWRFLDEYEMVVGSRYLKKDGSNSEMGTFRKFMMFFVYRETHQAGSKLSDPTTGFFAIRKEVLHRCKFRPLTWKTCLEIELRAHPSMIEVPIIFGDREKGVSKRSMIVAFSIMFQLEIEGWIMASKMIVNALKRGLRMEK